MSITNFAAQQSQKNTPSVSSDYVHASQYSRFLYWAGGGHLFIRETFLMNPGLYHPFPMNQFSRKQRTNSRAGKPRGQETKNRLDEA